MPSTFTPRSKSLLTSVLVFAAAGISAAGQERLVTATLTYGAPGSGPAPNFSPKGTQTTLTDVAPGMALPEGAVRPAKSGTIQIGPSKASWIPVLATADAAHPADLCRLYFDRNRNGDFSDDGPAVTAKPTQNEKTKAFWSSFTKTELTIPYGRGAVEPYLVSLWIVRDEDGPAPGIMRHSVASWRTGTVSIEGVEALVAVMDSNSDAVFDKTDTWSVLAASTSDGAKKVLSLDEARSMNRMMFVDTGAKELVLEFRAVTPDGRAVEFAVVDRPMTKKADRAPDDLVAGERTRPRTETPFVWSHGKLDAVLATAKAAGKRVFVDFETTWCGPCKTMDQWVFNDAEVAALLAKDFVGIKLDGDVEKAHVKTYSVRGYPTGIILDATGNVLQRFEGYQSSKELLALLRR